MKEKTNDQFKNYIIRLSKAILSSVIVSTIISLTSSAILLTTPDPTAFLPLAAIFTIYCSFITGSIIASKNSPTPILYSCIYCFIHLLIIYIMSLLIPDVCTAGKLVNLLISYIGAPILSIFIVYLTTKDTKRKPYYKKRKLR